MLFKVVEVPNRPVVVLLRTLYILLYNVTLVGPGLGSGSFLPSVTGIIFYRPSGHLNFFQP
jgi:hypothetical protein